MAYFCVRLLVLMCLCSQLAGCSLLSSTKKIPIKNAHNTIYFIYHDWHTTILLEADAYKQHSRVLSKNTLLQSELQNKKYLRVGWGDGDYFTGKRKSIGSATKALIASDYSALQVLGYSQDPFADIPEETRVSLLITDKALRRLVRYIDNSFATKADGALIDLPAYTENTGLFFQSNGHYSLFSNCNTWSSRALQTAGLPIRSRLHLTAQSVFDQARTISLAQQTQLGLLIPE